MNRPKRITILSLLLGWLSFAGFANCLVMISKGTDNGLLMGVLAGLYGTAALVSSIGLWRLNKWAAKAFLVWSALVVVMAFVMQTTFVGMPTLQFSGFLVVVILILFFLNRFVMKVIGNTSLTKA
tara:strand:- start:1632 stop:2006 length:375 start_codon:yes stop_codon:yes gene_type:complete